MQTTAVWRTGDTQACSAFGFVHIPAVSCSCDEAYQLVVPQIQVAAIFQKESGQLWKRVDGDGWERQHLMQVLQGFMQPAGIAEVGCVCAAQGITRGRGGGGGGLGGAVNVGGRYTCASASGGKERGLESVVEADTPRPPTQRNTTSLKGIAWLPF